MEKFIRISCLLTLISLSTGASYATNVSNFTDSNQPVSKMVIQSEPCLVVVTNFSEPSDNDEDDREWSVEEEMGAN